MQFVADYFPLILFFVAFKLAGIYVATGVAIAASVVQIAYFRWRRGRVAAIHWVSLAIIAGFLLVATVIAVLVELALLFPGQMLRWLAQFNELGMAAFQALGPWAGVLLPLLAGGNGWRVISPRVRVAAKGCEGAVELFKEHGAGQFVRIRQRRK